MIDIPARLLLWPLLYSQANHVRATTLSLPEPRGPRAGIVGRGPRLRLLVIGDSSAAGVGVNHQRDALAAPLAQQLARHGNVRVEWELLAATGLTSEAMLSRLKRAGPLRADVAVVIAGVNDITNEVPVAHALRLRGRIAIWLAAHAGVRAVYFPALPEMDLFPSLPEPLAWWAGQMSRRNNRAQARWAQRWPCARPHVAHVPMDGAMVPTLMAHDGFHPAAELYAIVAGRIAEFIVADRAAASNGSAVDTAGAAPAPAPRATKRTTTRTSKEAA